MGKKPATKAKAKAAGYAAAKVEEAEPEMTAEQIEAKRLWQARRDGGKWCDAQLSVLWNMIQHAHELAKKNGIGSTDYLVAAHEFHQKKLLRLQKRLKEKELDGVPQELKDGVEAYIAQFGTKMECEKDDLKEIKEPWDLVEEVDNKFVRPAETAEATKAMDELKEWTACTTADMEKFVGILKANLSSGGAQEVGFMRIGWLCSDAVDKKTTPEGLTVATLFPAIKSGMEKQAADPGVQRAGCAALRGLASIEGQLTYLCDAGGAELAVEALKAHFTDKEVAYAANGFFWVGGQKAGKNSAENTRMRTAGAIEALAKVLKHWAWDQTLCGRVRVTLPFLTED